MEIRNSQCQTSGHDLIFRRNKTHTAALPILETRLRILGIVSFPATSFRASMTATALTVFMVPNCRLQRLKGGTKR
jgi:hypothetical protein